MTGVLPVKKPGSSDWRESRALQVLVNQNDSPKCQFYAMIQEAKMAERGVGGLTHHRTAIWWNFSERLDERVDKDDISNIQFPEVAGAVSLWDNSPWNRAGWAKQATFEHNFTKWGLCEYVIHVVHTLWGGSPVILWSSLGGKPKWLPWYLDTMK